MNHVRRLRTEAHNVACRGIAKILVTSNHIENRARLGDKASRARSAEPPRVTEPIMRPPADASAVPKADDSWLGGVLATPYDEGRIEPQAPVAAVKPERDGLGATAAIDRADL